MVIVRKGKEQTVKVTLGRLEDDQVKADGSDFELVPDSGVLNPDEGEGDDQATNPDQQQDDQQQAPSAEAAKNILGMKLSALDAESRKTFGIADSVDGVVITDVAKGSPAADKGLKPGEVIVEVAQEFMQSPGAVSTKVAALKKEGRRNAQMMIASANGDLRFLAVPLD